MSSLLQNLANSRSQIEVVQNQIQDLEGQVDALEVKRTSASYTQLVHYLHDNFCNRKKASYDDSRCMWDNRSDYCQSYGNDAWTRSTDELLTFLNTFTFEESVISNRPKTKRKLQLDDK